MSTACYFCNFWHFSKFRSILFRLCITNMALNFKLLCVLLLLHHKIYTMSLYDIIFVAIICTGCLRYLLILIFANAM